MNGTIIDVLNGLRQAWGEMYVIAQENAAAAAEIQSKAEAMMQYTARMTTLSAVCAWLGFALAAVAVGLLIGRGR